MHANKLLNFRAKKKEFVIKHTLPVVNAKSFEFEIH